MPWLLPRLQMTQLKESGRLQLRSEWWWGLSRQYDKPSKRHGSGICACLVKSSVQISVGNIFVGWRSRNGCLSDVSAFKNTRGIREDMIVCRSRNERQLKEMLIKGACIVRRQRLTEKSVAASWCWGRDIGVEEVDAQLK